MLAIIGMGAMLATGTPCIANDTYRRDPANLFVEKGYGILADYYAGGRGTARYAEFGGLFQVRYWGKDGPSWFFDIGDHTCTYFQLFRLDLLIDGKAWKPEFTHTEHYPFGYVSECTLDGVRLRHEFVVDDNAFLRRLRVLDNPLGKRVRARIVHEQWTAAFGKAGNGVTYPKLMPDYDHGSLTSTLYRVKNGQRETVNTVAIGAVAKATFPINRREFPVQPDRFFITETEEAEQNADHVFYLVIDRKPGEDLTGTRVDAAFERFRRQRADNAVFDTGDTLVDSALMSAPMISRSLTLRDVPGAVRAAPYYFVWGWDAMAHTDSLALLGHEDQVRDILAFFLKSFSKNGIASSYSRDLFGSAPTAWVGWQQLFIPILLNGYYQITGDERTKEKYMPLSKYIVGRINEERIPGKPLIKCDMSWPDHPKRLMLTTNDWFVINNSRYYQMLRSWEELTGTHEQYTDDLLKGMNDTFWNEENEFYCDSVDGTTGWKRPFYSMDCFMTISRFGTDLVKARGMKDARRIAAKLERENATPIGIRSMSLDAPGYQVDGGFLGTARPVTDRPYWNIQNFVGNVRALRNFRNAVARNWETHTCPEGQLIEFENEDFKTHNDCTGGKQHFACTAWPWEYLELQYGLAVTAEGVRFRAMNDGRAVSVRNLHLRGTRLDVFLSGFGSEAKYELNGKPLAEGFIPWKDLRKDRRNVLKITMFRLITGYRPSPGDDGPFVDAFLAFVLNM